MQNFIKLTSATDDNKQVIVKVSEILSIEDSESIYEVLDNKMIDNTKIQLTNNVIVYVKECAGVVAMMCEKCLSE